MEKKWSTNLSLFTYSTGYCSLLYVNDGCSFWKSPINFELPHFRCFSTLFACFVIIIKNIEIKQQKLGWTTVVASVSQFLFVVVTGRAIDLTESNFVVSNFEMSQFGWNHDLLVKEHQGASILEQTGSNVGTMGQQLFHILATNTFFFFFLKSTQVLATILCFSFCCCVFGGGLELEVTVLLQPDY